MIDKSRLRKIERDYLKSSVIFDLAIFKTAESMVAADYTLALKYFVVAMLSLAAYLFRAKERVGETTEKVGEVVEDAAEEVVDGAEDVADGSE